MLGKYAIGNIVYYVSDDRRTEAFYRDMLGLAVDPHARMRPNMAATS